ncbi:MAG: response regulator [Nitrosarchaeum sp.]|nr:response regulator [Nitrosarchaeum sp.]
MIDPVRQAENPKIVIIDDEPQNRELYERICSQNFGNLRTKQGRRIGFDLITCASAEEALEVVEDLDIEGIPLALWLSDMQLGEGMRGSEFLARVRETHPKAIRLGITAYETDKHMRRTLDQADVFKFMDKGKVIESSDGNLNAQAFIDSVGRGLVAYLQNLSPEILIRDGRAAGTLVKEVETRYELNQAGNLRFRVYHSEIEEGDIERLTLERILAAQPNEAERARAERDFNNRIISDKYDLAPTTTHIVAMKDGECIGHVRIMDGDNPMRRDAPDYVLKKEDEGKTVREISKLMIRKDFRGGGRSILPSIFRLVYQDSKRRARPDLFLSCLDRRVGLYQKIGFRDEGVFFNHTEFPAKYRIMHVNIEHAIGNFRDRTLYPDANPGWIRAITVPIPDADERLLGQVNEILQKGLAGVSYMLDKYGGIRF